MKQPLLTAAVGVALGFILSRIGFSSWDEVHRMFTFADLRLFLTFCVAVVLLAAGWLLLRNLPGIPVSPRPIHPGTLPGAVLFGAGWAISGACPAITLVQLGEGQLGAVWTLAGILLGNWLYAVVHQRYFKWSPGVCLEP